MHLDKTKHGFTRNGTSPNKFLKVILFLWFYVSILKRGSLKRQITLIVFPKSSY